jgi:serine phosphatase RsbU (regulator of sigma subunit)
MAAITAVPAREYGLATEISRWKSAAGTCPSGGDWCDVVDISDDAFALTIGDVSGHGTAASTTMRRIRSWTLKGIRQRRAPADILRSVNAFVHERFGDTLATAIVAILNRRQRTLTYANAGHPPPLLLSHNMHVVLEHSLSDLPLGVVANHRSTDHVLSLESGALLIAYTNGITDHARDLVRGEAELLDAGRAAHENSVREAAGFIAENVLRDARGTDDAAILAIRIVPAQYSLFSKGAYRAPVVVPQL